MSNAACKATWCDENAKVQLKAAIDFLENAKEETPELRVKLAEAYLVGLNVSNDIIKKEVS